MENLGKLIRKFATQEVLDGISRRMKNAGDEEACLWIADPTNEKYYRNWKESEKSQELYEKEKMGYGWHVNSVGMMGGNFTNDSFEDPLKDIRLKFKYVWEFKEFLEIYQNYVDEFSDFEIIHSSDHPYVQSVIDLLKKDYPEWILKEGVGICNRWEASLGKRIQEKITAWKIVNTETGTYADFHTGSLADDGIVNLMFFKIEKSKRGNGIFVLRQFKIVSDIILFRNPEKVNGFTSIVLQLDDNFEKKIQPWRFKKVSKRQTKLGRYWEACGGVMAQNIGWNEGEAGMMERIYFFSEENALYIHEGAKKNGWENPFRHSKRTVYRKEIEAKLKS